MSTVHEKDDQTVVDPTPAPSRPPSPRPWRRRRYQVAAVLGVVAAAFGTAALVTHDARPGPGTTAGHVNASDAITVTNSGSMPKDHHTLRVVSAARDLSGQRELTWA